MKGLLQKDFYLMRTLARSYAFILGVFFLISLTGVYDGTFLCTFVCAGGGRVWSGPNTSSRFW